MQWPSPVASDVAAAVQMQFGRAWLVGRLAGQVIGDFRKIVQVWQPVKIDKGPKELCMVQFHCLGAFCQTLAVLRYALPQASVTLLLLQLLLAQPALGVAGAASPGAARARTASPESCTGVTVACIAMTGCERRE